LQRKNPNSTVLVFSESADGPYDDVAPELMELPLADSVVIVPQAK
jgi:hypothetical protein